MSPQRLGSMEAFDAAVGGGRRRRSAHAPGRVLADLAVMLADGGATIGDLAVLRDQPGLFGPVASTATAWRVLDTVDEPLLDQLKTARAVARERAWLLRGEAGRTAAAGAVCRHGGAGAGDRRRRHPGDLPFGEAGRRRRRSSTGLAITRCSPGWTTPARRWRGCCGRETRTPTPPTTTSSER